jgi:hypothetical protein
MTNYNIQMKQRNAANNGWNNIYPTTLDSNVIDSKGKTLQAQNKVFDITATPVSFHTVLSLPEGNYIMQGFYLAQGGKYIFTNWADGGSPESYLLFRMSPTGKIKDYMTLTNFGHGTILGIEDIGTDTYIWSNMTIGTTNYLVRFKYVAGANYTASTTDSAYSHYSNFGSGEEVHYTIDGLYIIFIRSLGTGNGWKIEKRLLSDVKAGTNVIISSFNLPVAYLWGQGAAVDVDINTFYWLSGDTNGATHAQLLTTFDLTLGTKLSETAVNFGEGSNGVAEGAYKEPEGLSLYKDTVTGAKSLFVGVTTGDTHTRYNKVFAFHSFLNTQKFQGVKNMDIPMDTNPDWGDIGLPNDYYMVNTTKVYYTTVGWSYSPQYRKVTGNTVKLRGCISFPAGTTLIDFVTVNSVDYARSTINGTATQLASAPISVPYGYRPKKMQRRMVACDGTLSPARVSVDNSNGYMTIAVPTGATSVWIDMEYNLND